MTLVKLAIDVTKDIWEGRRKDIKERENVVYEIQRELLN